jgi:hypothetical protein
MICKWSRNIQLFTLKNREVRFGKKQLVLNTGLLYDGLNVWKFRAADSDISFRQIIVFCGMTPDSLVPCYCIGGTCCLHLQSRKSYLKIRGGIIKSFYSLWRKGHPWRASKHCNLQLFPWPHSMIFLYFLFHPLLSFTTFSSTYLFFCTPEDSSPMRFSLLLLRLYVMCVQPASISFFLSEFLLA